MLDQEYRRAGIPGPRGEGVDPLDDPFDLEGGLVADTERALDVDDQECSGHGCLP
ncbi:hypothetical protein D3C72_2214630 [compost metagenome]